MKSLHAMKQKGRALRKHLAAAFGKEVTLSQAYEALAAMEGAQNWNTLAANLVSVSSSAPMAGAPAPRAVVSAMPSIRAVLVTDDVAVEFDATAWFIQAADTEIHGLCDERPTASPVTMPFAYGNGPFSESVVKFCALSNKALRLSSTVTGESKATCFVDVYDLHCWWNWTFACSQSGFIARNGPSLIIVPNWAEFVSWAKEGGYDESYFDINDEKCFTLQQAYLQEMAESRATTVRDVDLWRTEHRQLMFKVCTSAWGSALEGWKERCKTPGCEFIIESSDIFQALGDWSVTSTGDEGFHDEAEMIVEDALLVYGFHRQARLLFEGKADIDVPFEPDMPGNPEACKQERLLAESLSTMLKVVEVNLVDVLNEYDVPEDAPEWKWVGQHHSFAHKGNGAESGVWEFMVNVAKMEGVRDIPDTLRSFFNRAKTEGAAWVMFHQG